MKPKKLIVSALLTVGLLTSLVLPVEHSQQSLTKGTKTDIQFVDPQPWVKGDIKDVDPQPWVKRGPQYVDPQPWVFNPPREVDPQPWV